MRPGPGPWFTNVSPPPSGAVVLLWALSLPPATELCPLTWTDVQVLMTLVPRLVLSLRSSGKEGAFSTRGACVAWNEGFLGDRFTSVPLPKAWMAFPVGGREQGGAKEWGLLLISQCCLL